MALSEFSATEQRIIKLLSATLNAAPTPDLLEELATYANAGASAEALLATAFNNSVVVAKYPALKDGGETAAFLSTFVENATAGADVSASVKASWKAALVSDYEAYYEAAGDDATDAGFAIWLLDILAGATFPAGSDLAKVQANLTARAEEAADQIADSTQTYDPAAGWDQFEIDGEGPVLPGQEFRLESTQDKLLGTAGNDTFLGYIFDNQNTLQSGDIIDGGNGIDTLYGDIGNSQEFAITPELTNVEQVKLRAQTTTVDQADNNIGSPVLLEQIYAILDPLLDALTGGGPLPPDTEALLAKVNQLVSDNWRGSQYDAERSVGVNHWESNNSRADLIVEDVRILDNQITKDITVAFVQSDPGNVDFGLYFDQHSLRKESGTQTTALTLSVYNPLAVANGYDAANPLENIPYDQLTIQVNGNPITVSFNLDDVTTYDEFYAVLTAAFEAAFDEYPELAGGTITRLENSKSFFSVDGELRTADEFVLTLPNNVLTPNNPGWNASEGLPPDNAFAANVQQGTPVVTEALITSTIILDDVGRGSTGGDLVIGGLSTGETSASKGVEQFDITVERSSKLQSIASTNNTLEVVNIKSGAQYNEVKNGQWTGNKYGDLTVLGSVDVTGYGSYLDKYVNKGTGDIGLPGAVAEEATGFGLVDVRVVDASDFQGDLALSVLLTGRVGEKYADRVDTDPDPAKDDVDFQYDLGLGDDTFALQVAFENFNDGATTFNDFDLAIDGGAGNDQLFGRVGIDLTDPNTGAAADSSTFFGTNWYLNSKLNANLGIAGGAGDDVVRTEQSGDWFVDLGAGNDTYYADNSGAKAVWVFNGVANAPAYGTGHDIASDVNDAYTFVKGELTVTIERANGEVLTTTVALENPAGNSTDLHVNQAIKDAINNDPVLSKLLVAKDGPAFSLVVESLIDGEWVAAADDIAFSITSSTLTSSDLSAYNRANPGSTFATLGALQAAQDASVTAWDTAADYVSTGPILPGVDSINQADNTVYGGAGDDVIVLGTGQYSSDTIAYNGLNNGLDTVLNFLVGTGADPAVLLATQTAINGTADDVIDFTSYGAVDLLTALPAAGSYTDGDKYIVVTEHYDANSGVDFIVELYEATGDAAVADALLGTIVELDFGGQWDATGTTFTAGAVALGDFVVDQTVLI